MTLGFRPLGTRAVGVGFQAKLGQNSRFWMETSKECMLTRLREFDPEGDVIALSFATRLLLTDLDRDLIIERALESLADFGRTDRIGLYLLEPAGEHLLGEGGPVGRGRRDSPLKVPFESTPCEDVLTTRDPSQYQVLHKEGIPWPVEGSGIPGRKCLCAPLVAANNKAIGVVVFEHDEGYDLPPISMQSLIVLLTVVAISLETARLFEHAVYDGLTGLYVRRYFDLRLQEEVNRIRRYGGRMALLITDIDFFKGFNDRYGHQQGDDVLRETGRILREAVRKKLDAVCRYGGEEFAIIMPDTDLAGATVVAERIRQRCQCHAFPGPNGNPLRVTLSGGVACMDQDCMVSGEALLQRADECLYRAKECGRNQIQIQED